MGGRIPGRRQLGSGALPLARAVEAEADRLADFVLFTQRSCILNLSGELSKGNVSFPQFFLMAYLSSEEYLTMSDIAKKMEAQWLAWWKDCTGSEWTGKAPKEPKDE